MDEASSPLSQIRHRKIIFTAAFFVWALYIGLTPMTGTDWLYSFRAGANGDLKYVVIPYWGLFLAWLPAHLPEPIGYAIWIGISILLVVWAAEKLHARTFFVLLSYQLHRVIFYGQIDPFVIAGLVLGEYSTRRSWPCWTGLAIMLLLIKPQIGLLPAIYFFLLSVDRKKTLLTAAGVGLASLVISPVWISNLWKTNPASFLQKPQNFLTNSSIGIPLPLGVLLAVAVLFSKIDRERKLIALVAANLFISPYATIYSQVALLCLGLPIGLYFFAFLPWFIAGVYGPFNPYWSWTSLFPLSALLYAYWPNLTALFHRLRPAYSKGITDQKA